MTLTREQSSALHRDVHAWLDEHGATILHDVVEPGVALAGAADGFTDGRLMAWVRRWEASDAARADLVVSDNLVGVLAARPDAVLMGSFLWSDVLESVADGPAVDAFVAQERALLAEHRPPMLATADVVHPGVVARTSAIHLPWFDDRPAAQDASGVEARDLIAVVGGHTGRADDRLARVTSALTASGREVVTSLEGPDRHRVGVLVCRPGLGTVTAGVVESTPMLLVREPNNPELDHTASALVSLGLARTLEDTADAGRILATVAEMEDETVQRRMRALLAARPTGGHRRAAGILAARLNGSDLGGTAEGPSGW